MKPNMDHKNNMTCIRFPKQQQLRNWFLTTGCLILLLVTQPALAATYFWTDSLGGDYDDLNNWSGLVVPLSTDNVLFDLGVSPLTPYTINFSANVNQNDMDVYDDAVIFDLGGNTYTTSTSTSLAPNATDDAYLGIRDGALNIGSILYVGHASSGILDIRSNGAVSNSSTGYVGYLTGSNGSVTVDGTGSSWTNSSLLYVGYQGNGGLDILNGANVSNTGGYVGRISGSNGTVTVDGTGSTWTNSSLLIVGRDGNGTLNVQNGGIVTNTNGTLGFSGGSSGVATVDGPDSSWTNTGTFYVGNAGTGTLAVQNGASLSNTTGYIGALAGSNGTVTVDGTGSIWSNSSSLYIGGTSAAAGGTGTLNIQNGGTVDVANTTRLWAAGTLNLDGGTLNTGSFDASAGAFNFTDGTLTVDGGTFTPVPGNFTLDGAAAADMPTLQLINGATANAVNDLRVGETNQGVLDLQNGGAVSNTFGVIGGNSGSTGTVTVEGTGSNWTNSSGLWVGSSGSGTLNIQNGGAVSSGLSYIGEATNGTGTATVDGTGSNWTNSGDLVVGSAGSGTLNIQNGGTVSNTRGFIGELVNGTGTATVDGTGSNWTNSDSLLIGSNGGSGTLNIQNGGTVSNTTAGYIGYNSIGMATVDGTGSNWTNSSSLLVGRNGNGTLNIQNGGTVSSFDGFIGENSGSTGTATVTGVGSTWTNTGSTYVGGDASAAGGTGQLQILAGGTVDVANTLQIWNTGSVDLTAGTLNVGDLTGDGTFNFNSGSLNFANNANVGLANPLGSNLTLNAVKLMSVGGTTTIDPFSVLTLDGGTFATGAMVNNGVFDFQRGTFNLTSANLTVGSGGLFGSTLQLDANRTVNVANTVTVANGGLVALSNGVLSGGTLANDGTIDLAGAASTLGGNTLTNNSLLTGNGRVTAALTNNTGAEVAAYTGDTLTFTDTGNTNNGTINLFGGAVRFDQDLTNSTSGLIAGSGNLIATGGLTNQGTVALSGGTTGVAGDVDNTTGGTIIVSGNSTATFFDDVIHNGAEFRVSDGSSAVFFGAVSGSGAYTGTGSLFFEGDLNPGNSPGLVSVQGDMGLGLTAQTIMEIAGLERGTEYDAFDIGGALSLGGSLEVALYDPGSGLFDPKLGDSFDLFIADTISGNFDLLTLASLGGGLGWQLDVLTDAIGLTDVVRLSVVTSAVPIPAAVWLFSSGFIALIGLARQRQAA